MKLERRSKDGYEMILTQCDTEAWATRPGSNWLPSTIRGRILLVAVNANGLTEVCLQTEKNVLPDPPGDEVEAIVSDYLPPMYRHLWPTWEKR